MSRFALGTVAAFALISTATFAGPLAGHPNLKAAHAACQNAIAKVSAAQAANEFDMEGHAAKAKDLLAQAEIELNAAGNAATANKK